MAYKDSERVRLEAEVARLRAALVVIQKLAHEAYDPFRNDETKPYFWISERAKEALK